jgi:Spy/CpxP family protein refolding chaperone
MYLRKKLTSAGLIVGLLAGLAVVASAQQPATQNPGPATDASRSIGRGAGRFRRGSGRPSGFGRAILRELNLTDDQRQQTRAIVKEKFAANQSLREELRQLGEKRRQGTLTTEEQARARTLSEQMRAAMKDTHERISSVLTPEQKARIAELRKERRADHERLGRKRRGFPLQDNPRSQP